jgi:hypothetical protein
MKRTFIIIVLTVFFFSFGKTKADEGLGFGIFGGLSTPNDFITNLYNRNTVDSLNLIYGSATFGWHVGVDLRIKLDKDGKSFLHGSFAWHQFDPVVNDVMYKGKKEPLFDATTSVLPIAAGVDYYLFRSVIGLYFRGDVQYNIITTRVHNVFDVIDEIKVMPDAKNNRLGAALGGGVEVNLLLIKAALEIKYNWINLVGKTVDEKPKNYLSTSIIVYL